jgi:hypothetical protein
MSGTILAFWPDGKVAADELPFTIDFVREKMSRKMAQELFLNSENLSR